jgi:hypothetical protein
MNGGKRVGEIVEVEFAIGRELISQGRAIQHFCDDRAKAPVLLAPITDSLKKSPRELLAELAAAGAATRRSDQKKKVKRR